MRKSSTAAFKAQIVREVLKEEKTVAQIAAEYQVHPNQIYRWREITLAGLPSLFAEQTAQVQAAKDAAHAQEVQDRYAEVGQLTTQLNWLKKVALLSRAERLTLLDRADPELSIRTQTRLLDLNRTNLYYHSVPPTADEVALKHWIDAIYTQ